MLLVRYGQVHSSTHIFGVVWCNGDWIVEGERRTMIYSAW